MAAVRKATTMVSTKGQVILPKAVRESRHREAGTCLEVEETDDGVLLRPARIFPKTRLDDVYGCLPHKGPAKSVGEMDEAIAAEVRVRHACGRY